MSVMELVEYLSTDAAPGQSTALHEDEIADIWEGLGPALTKGNTLVAGTTDTGDLYGFTGGILVRADPLTSAVEDGENTILIGGEVGQFRLPGAGVTRERVARTTRGPSRVREPGGLRMGGGRGGSGALRVINRHTCR